MSLHRLNKLSTSCNKNDLNGAKILFIAAKKLSLLLDSPMGAAQYWYRLLSFLPWYRNAVR